MTDIERLQLFDCRITELRHCRLIRDGFRAGVTVSWEQLRGLRFENRAPDEEDLRSFVLTFRHFVSDKEPIHLFRVYNACELTLRSDGLRGALRSARTHWKQALKGSGLTWVEGDRSVEPAEIADLWINGHYFHNDEEKRKRLTAGIGKEPLMRYAFHDFLIEATRQVMHTGNIVRIGLRDGLFDDQE